MSTANDIIAKAKAELGVKENPAGSNKVKYNTAYYGREVSGSNYPWCCAFVWWLFKECDASDMFYGGKKTASCTTLMNYYKKKDQFSTTPKVGSLVFFNWGKGSTAKHIGIVTAITTTGVKTIEGNTAIGNDSNGGEVMERTRDASDILGYAYPYPPKKVNASFVQNGSPKNPASIVDYAKDFSKLYAKTYTVTASALNMRRGASTNKGVLKVLKKGEKVTCYGYFTKNGTTTWLYVKHKDGTVGFCSKKYLK